MQGRIEGCKLAQLTCQLTSQADELPRGFGEPELQEKRCARLGGRNV